jgi:hypothetical protein
MGWFNGTDARPSDTRVTTAQFNPRRASSVVQLTLWFRHPRKGKQPKPQA